MGKHLKSADNKILARIYGFGMGVVFSPATFQDLGSPDAIHNALSRHAKAGPIRQLARGLYDYPRKDPQLGVLAPSVEAIADAIKGRDAVRIQSSGAYAANRLGLSDQVPMRVVFATDGSRRKVKVGNLQILLKPTTPRNMAMAGKISGLITQALQHLGQQNFTDDMLTTLRRRLTDADRKQLLKDIRYPPAWIAGVFRRLAADKPKI